MSERATLTGILFVLKPGIPWQMLVSRDGLQSAKPTEVGGKQRGYDGGKKVHGRKRQLLLVDTEGLTLKAKIHSAKVPDQDGLRLLAEVGPRGTTSAPKAPVGGCWLRGQWQAVGGRGLGLECGGGASSSKAGPGKGSPPLS